jgi:hypothetical protein
MAGLRLSDNRRQWYMGIGRRPEQRFPERLPHFLFSGTVTGDGFMSDRQKHFSVSADSTGTSDEPGNPFLLDAKATLRAAGIDTPDGHITCQWIGARFNARAMELETTENAKEAYTAGLDEIFKSRISKPAPARKKRGRPRKSQDDTRLWGEWQTAKANGVTMEAFARQKGLTPADVDNARKRLSNRRKQAQKNKRRKHRQ